MAIVKEVEHTWECGRPIQIRKGIKYLVQCDNPDCKKQFFREAKQVKRANKLGQHNIYCDHKCQFTHYEGVCESVDYPDCKNPITYRQSTHNKKGDLGNVCFKCCKKTKQKLHNSKRRQQAKDKLYNLLGNKCACCNQGDRMYLQIDHVNNDGAAHRESINNGGKNRTNPYSANHPKHLIKHLELFPSSLQILCANCNYAKQRNGGELYIPAK